MKKTKFGFTPKTIQEKKQIQKTWEENLQTMLKPLDEDNLCGLQENIEKEIESINPIMFTIIQQCIMVAIGQEIIRRKEESLKSN